MLRATVRDGAQACLRGPPYRRLRPLCV